jgi:DNA-binding transcriptional MerR regulator
MDSDLRQHKFTQTDVLAITQLRKELLQTWINRRVIELSEQHPGSGRRRLYSALDIVKLALMRRIADLGLDLAIGRELAQEAERRLLSNRGVEWGLHLTIRKRDATHERVKVQIVASAGHTPLTLNYNAMVGDAREMLVSHFTEPFESMFSRRKRIWMEEDRPIDPAKRAALARAGIHAEPALIFPFGEIVNGTLLQIEALEQGHLPHVMEAMIEISTLEKSDEAAQQKGRDG